jgi:Inorganic pyrophosphatase/exopolyphosphatase
MKDIFIIGHKKPDTDSVCSAIALSHLKNVLGENSIPKILGDLNNETKFVLDYFNIKEPEYLNDVKLQIKDLNYGKNNFSYCYDSLYSVIEKMREHHLSTIPIVDDKKKFVGLLSMRDITNKLISWEDEKINTSFDNIINTLQGESLLKFDDEIIGNVIVASYRSTTFINDINIDRNSILILGDRHSIIEYAVESGARLVIITGNNEIKAEHIEIAKKNNVNIIRTSLRTFNVVKVLGICNYAKTLLYNNDIISFHERDYVKEFSDIASKLRYKVFPVLTSKNDCLGVVQLSDISNKTKKKVILVDHNEIDQSVDGLEEAEIIEIVDHHKIGTLGTTQPINFRNMTLGCTCSIIYLIYKENKIDIPKDIAGIMLASIISDTLIFCSPTTTDIDKDIAYDLAKIADIEIESFAHDMFKKGSSLKGKTVEDILFTDFKIFTIDKIKIGIGQISITSLDELNKVEKELSLLIEDTIAEQDYNMVALFATDIIKEGSHIYYNEKAKDTLEKAFETELYQGCFLKEIISRKKQIIPNIMNVYEEK